MTTKLKTALAAAGVSIAAVALTACGASTGDDASASTGQMMAAQAPAGTTGSTGTAGAMPPQGAGGPFASLTSDDLKCLEKQGVTVPSGPPDQGQDQSAKKPPTVKAMKKAAKGCGIDLPDPPSQGGAPGRPGGSGQVPPQGMPPAGQAPGASGSTSQPPAAATS